LHLCFLLPFACDFATFAFGYATFAFGYLCFWLCNAKAKAGRNAQKAKGKGKRQRQKATQLMPSFAFDCSTFAFDFAPLLLTTHLCF
jgi:hypothetical protein